MGDGRGRVLVTPEYGVRINAGSRLWSPAASTTAAAVGVVQFNGSTTSNLTAWVNGTKLTPRSTGVANVQTAGTGTVGAWTAAPVSATTFRWGYRGDRRVWPGASNERTAADSGVPLRQIRIALNGHENSGRQSKRSCWRCATNSLCACTSLTPSPSCRAARTPSCGRAILPANRVS